MPWRITKLAQFVRAHNAARATGVGAVKSAEMVEMYFSQSLTSSAQDLLTPGRAAGPTANRPTAQLTPIAPDRDAEQRHDIAMFTSSCGPPRPQGVFSCG